MSWTERFSHCAGLARNLSEIRSQTALTTARFWSETGLLASLNVLVIVGNVFVLLALVIDRQLRHPTHYFIGSLAIADLTLGLLVLPEAIAFQVLGVWIFGSVFCQIWLAIDVWLCTASIYSLVAVTFDRYIAITKPLSYKSVMTNRRACALILGAWTLSLIICLPAFAMSLHSANRLAEITCQCTQMAHTTVYITYSAFGSFFVPMAVVVYFYARIYVTIRMTRLSGSRGIVNVGRPSMACGGGGGGGGGGGSKAGGGAEHATLLEKGRQVSSALRIHKGRYHPGRFSRKGLVARLSGGAAQMSNSFRRKQVTRSADTSAATSTAVSTTDLRFLDPSAAVGRPEVTAAAMTSGLKVDPEQFLGDGLREMTGRRRSACRHISPIVTPIGRRRSSSSASRTLLSSDPTSRPAASLLVHLTMPTQLASIWCQRITSLQKYQKKFSLELRALKSVGVVTGCFFICWMGFCVVYTMQALPACRDRRESTVQLDRKFGEVTTIASAAGADFSRDPDDPGDLGDLRDLYESDNRRNRTLTESLDDPIDPDVIDDDPETGLSIGIETCVPNWIISFMVWLGYANSALNPIIYGISNKQFRRTFRRILWCDFCSCCGSSSSGSSSTAGVAAIAAAAAAAAAAAGGTAK